MSANIPFDLQEEIFKWLPVKSLIRFRSVSKAWKSTIDSHDFIAVHSLRHSHSHRLLVRYTGPDEPHNNYVCIVDDHTFPQHKFDPTIPLSVERCMVLGSSHGLFCFSGYYDPIHKLSKQMAVVWNPSIRKSITISLPNVSYADERVFGFGVCPVNSDPKILMTSICKPVQLKVFTLSSGAWRSLTLNQPFESYYPIGKVIDRFIYWLNFNKSIAIDGGGYNLISFDLTNDEFGKVHLPDKLALSLNLVKSIYKMRESLLLIEENFKANNQRYDVWMMEDGIRKTFTKVFTIESCVFINKVAGFRKNGEPIMVVKDSDRKVGLIAQAVYEPFSQHMNYPVISGPYYTFSVYSYTETLLLLNQPGF